MGTIGMSKTQEVADDDASLESEETQREEKEKTVHIEK